MALERGPFYRGSTKMDEEYEVPVTAREPEQAYEFEQPDEWAELAEFGL